MRLKKEILDKVAESSVLRKKLREALGVSKPTIGRMVKDNDDALTKAAALKIICEYFYLNQEQVLEKENKAA